MRSALALGRRGLGRTWPNPAVGCVLVKDGVVAGRGWTQPGGRPHAETEALARAGSAARGATAYVTLEPCAHHGQTPPCADALVRAGVAHAVVAIRDPDPRVNGQGIAALINGGVAVTEGVLADEASELNAGFLMRVQAGRPLVTAKVASSLDGRIATADGESRWITGEDARAHGHLLRAQSDAIVIGSGTALADNPMLDCRLWGMADRSPVRVVLDGRLRTPLTAHLVTTARTQRTWLVTMPGSDHARRKAFAESGVEVIEVAVGAEGSSDPAAALAALAKRGITRVLVEGGRHLAAALLRAKLVDRLVWYRAPILLGGDGIAAASAFGLGRLADAPHFERMRAGTAGEDTVEWFRATRSP